MFKENKKVNDLALTVDPLLQDLMVGVFSMAIGLWHKDIGKIINPAIKNDKLSPKLKSVLLTHFFK